MIKHKLCAPLAPLAILLFASHAPAVFYSATILPNLPGRTNTRPEAISGQSIAGWSGAGANANHALYWANPSALPVDLNPAGFANSFAFGASGSNQAGYAQAQSDLASHAILWSGTAASAVDLSPAGYTNSYAQGTSGSNQIGYAINTVFPDAILWSGTAASAVKLTPPNYLTSIGAAISSDTQVGNAHPSGVSFNHAMLWHGTAASGVDLNPAGFNESYATGVAGTSQVGYGANSGVQHALLWQGTAASAVDLHPATYLSSQALDVSSTTQVGYGDLGTGLGGTHALVWNGSAATAIDLQSYLPATFQNTIATGISATGVIIGRGQAVAGGDTVGIVWTPIAESGVPGDYNNDGIVGAGDYVVWRKGNPLFNKVTPGGSNTPADFTAWRSRFGNSTPVGSGISTESVPEPASCTLVAIAIASAIPRRYPRSRSMDDPSVCF